MPLPTRVSQVTSDPKPISPEDGFGHHLLHTNNECPTATNRRKRHEAHASHRQVVTTTWSYGKTTRSYVDHCKCQFCGHEWKQEWMPA